MARRKQRDTQDNWTAILDSAMDISQVTCDILDAGETGVRPTPPFYFNVESEKMECTVITPDTPSGGRDRLTVARGVLGSAAATHIDASIAVQRAYASQISELNQAVKSLQVLASRMLGGAQDGIQQTASSGTEDLKVIAQGSPDMTFDVASPGAGMAGGTPVGISENIISPTQTAPSANPRIDVVSLNENGILIITIGTEDANPSAPSTPSGNLRLATIHHRVASVSIKNSDDASNSYITDKRGEGISPWI